MKQKQTKVFTSATLALLGFACGLYAQVSFQITTVARPGDGAPVPQELIVASSPSLNDSGQVAFTGDSAVFLASGAKQVVVAGIGDPAPGGGTFLTAGSPSINEQGQIAFQGNVTPPGHSGIFLFSDGKISKIVADGDPAPEGGTLSAPNSPSLNAAGQVAFVAFPSPGVRAIYLYSGGSITRLAGLGDPAPGGGTFSLTVAPSLNAAGQVAFTALLSPEGEGIYLASEGSITKIARTGDPAPSGGTFSSFSAPPPSLNDPVARMGDPVASGGTLGFSPFQRTSLNNPAVATGSPAPAGGTFGFFSFQRPGLNNAGQVVFSAYVSFPGLSGIFLFSEGVITEPVRVGDPAPGGGFFTYADAPSLNAAGQIAFQGFLSTGGFGVFFFSGGSVTKIVRPGDGSPEGDTFASGSQPVLNAGGQVVFTGQLINQIGGVYLSSKGITRIAGQGDPVPRDPKFLSAFPLTINGAGSVVFSGSMFPGGNGLFDEAPTAIARAGDPAPGGGVFTGIASLGHKLLNDSGQVAFLGFLSTGNTGLFLSSDGSISKIAGSGDPAPGGGSFQSFDIPSMNNQGQVAFAGDVLSPGRPGLFLFSEGIITRLVGLGDPAPGGGTISFVNYASLNDQGQVAFFASVLPPGRWGIFLWSEGNIRAIAQRGDPAPEGGTFDLSSASSLYAPSLNAGGQVAFGTPLSTGSTGVFLFSEGVVRKIVRPGDPAPGGGTFSFADSASLNDSGQVAFPGATSGGFGSFVYSEGTISTVAISGDPAPGGGIFAAPDFPKLNAQGQVTFVSGLSTGGSGAFLATPQ